MSNVIEFLLVGRTPLGSAVRGVTRLSTKARSGDAPAVSEEPKLKPTYLEELSDELLDTLCDLAAVLPKAELELALERPRTRELLAFDEMNDAVKQAIINNGGEVSACGWCKDKWGLSWQITPREIFHVPSMLSGRGHPPMAARVRSRRSSPCAAMPVAHT